MTVRLLRAGAIALGLELLFGACSGSEDEPDGDASAVGGATHTGGRLGVGGRLGTGGRDHTGSGSDSGDGGGGGDSGDDSDSGGRSPGSGGRRGTGGNSSGAGGGTEAVGGAGTAESCGGKTPPAEGQKTTNVDGTEREYYLIPSTTTEPVPLVIDFHGFGGKGEWEVGTFAFNEASEGKAVLMYPDGLEQDFGGGVGWDNRGSDTPDIHFVEQLIVEAKRDHCIDESKIFIVGFSWGGWMATQTACALGAQVRAFISVAGGGPSGQCEDPVTGMIVHGSSDGSEPIESGMASRDHFGEENECSDDSSPAFDGDCELYAGCTKPLYWCQHPGDHIVPSFIYDVGWDFLMGAP